MCSIALSVISNVFDVTGSSTSMFRYDEGLKLMVEGKIPRESFEEIQSVLTEQIRLIDSGNIFYISEFYNY